MRFPVGRVIHIESLRPGFRGRWVGATEWMHVQESSEKDIYFKSWSQFLVKSCDNGHVCLESLSGPNHYINDYKGAAKVRIFLL